MGSESKAPIILSIVKVHKADQLRYHVIKCVAQHTEIVDKIHLFTTNVAECINS